MQNYACELPFSFGSAKVEVNLTGRYGDLDDQADDRLRSAIVVSLVQLPQRFQSQQQADNDSSTVRGSQSISQQQGPRSSSAVAPDASSIGSIKSSTSGTAQRSDTASSQQGHDENATVRIQNGSGSIEATATIRITRLAGQSQLRPELIQNIANSIAATVMNHADSAIMDVPATNDAFVQLTRYLTARPLPQSHHAQGELVGNASGNQSGNQR